MRFVSFSSEFFQSRNIVRCLAENSLVYIYMCVWCVFDAVDSTNLSVLSNSGMDGNSSGSDDEFFSQLQQVCVMHSDFVQPFCGICCIGVCVCVFVCLCLVSRVSVTLTLAPCICFY